MENFQQIKQAVIRQLAWQTSPFRLRWRGVKNTVAAVFTGLVTVSLIILIVIVILSLLDGAWPLLSTIPLKDLILGETWSPTRAQFGMRPFITSSVYVTLIALGIAIPSSLLCAIYLAEYSRWRHIIKPVIDLLASIPSVVYGLWGVFFIVPLIRDTIGPWSNEHLARHSSIFANNNPSGYSLLAGGIVLAIMTMPIIIAVAEEVLRSVPQGMREASLALGATEWETTKLVVLRKAWPGILAAIVLGFSRAFGETLAVVMVIGNVGKPIKSIFDPAYPLTATLANNYGEMMSIPSYKSALMLVSLILLTVVVLFNIAARLILVRLERSENL